MGIWKDKIRKDWRYAFRYLGKPYAGGGFKTKSEAVTAREDRRKQVKIMVPTQGGMALSLAVSLYLDQAEKRFVEKTYKYKRYVLRGFLENCGDKPIGNIDSQDVFAYLAQRPSNFNFNRHRKELVALFNFAKTQLRCIGKESPVELVHRLPEKKFVKYIPPKEDVQRVLETAYPKDRLLLLLLIHSMARIGEILRLKWKDVDFEKKIVRLWTRKTSDGSMVYDDIPTNRDLEDVLRILFEQRVQNEWVIYFRKLKGPYVRRPKLMKGLCRKAKVRPFGFHALRHWGATNLASKGIAHKTLSDLLRHRSLQTTEIYLQSLDEAKVEAVKQLEGEFMLALTDCKHGSKRRACRAKGAK